MVWLYERATTSYRLINAFGNSETLRQEFATYLQEFESTALVHYKQASESTKILQEQSIRCEKHSVKLLHGSRPLHGLSNGHATSALKTCNSYRTVVLLIPPDEVSFCQVQLPSGAAVKLVASYWGMSVYVRVAEDDDEKTEGFCGNNNGDRNDDMIGRNDVTYTKNPGSIAKDAFVDSWRFAFGLSGLIIFISCAQGTRN